MLWFVCSVLKTAGESVNRTDDVPDAFPREEQWFPTSAG